MGDELTILLEAFHKIEKAGGQATLSLSTSSGKTKVKLETSTTAAPPSVSPSQPASLTPGRRHRRRGARARARRNLRAAAHQASLAYFEAVVKRWTQGEKEINVESCDTEVLNMAIDFM